MKPSITTTEPCIFHPGRKSVSEIRLETDTRQGAVIQTYAPLCALCDEMYKARPAFIRKKVWKIYEFKLTAKQNRLLEVMS